MSDRGWIKTCSIEALSVPFAAARQLVFGRKGGFLRV
jgi:hypothetical protein